MQSPWPWSSGPLGSEAGTGFLSDSYPAFFLLCLTELLCMVRLSFCATSLYLLNKYISYTIQKKCKSKNKSQKRQYITKFKKENNNKIHVLWYCSNLTLLMPIIAFTQSKWSILLVCSKLTPIFLLIRPCLQRLITSGKCEIQLYIMPIIWITLNIIFIIFEKCTSGLLS